MDFFCSPFFGCFTTQKTSNIICIMICMCHDSYKSLFSLTAVQCVFSASGSHSDLYLQTKHLPPPHQPAALRPILLHLAQGHIHRWRPMPNICDEVQWSALSFSRTFERSPVYFGIRVPPSVSVKHIICEIENNHVERDWDGSSLSCSPSRSTGSRLPPVKVCYDSSVAPKTRRVKNTISTATHRTHQSAMVLMDEMISCFWFIYENNCS